MEEVRKNHLRDYLTYIANRGCSVCGNIRTHILIDKTVNSFIKYRVCCPNCGVVDYHEIMGGFQSNNEAFNFLLTKLGGDKNESKEIKI